MEMSRGDLITVALPGDYGKPRPALIVQADAFLDLDSLTILRLTSDRYDAPLVRVDVSPKPGNGLRWESQIMIDKAATVPKARIGQRIGRLDGITMRKVDELLARFLGLG